MKEPLSAPPSASDQRVNEPAPATRERSEADWEWLREKSLAGMRTTPPSKEGRWAIMGAVASVILLLGMAFFVWSHRDMFRGGSKPASAAESPDSAPVASPGVSIDLPNVTSSQQPTDGTRSNKSETPSKTRKAVAPVADAPPAISPKSDSLADNGREDLNQGRKYLEGRAVPKNSWMASQFLWKAVAKQNSEAVLLLSDLYARGDGVPRSCEQARILLIAGAKKGSSAAANKLRSIEQTCR